MNGERGLISTDLFGYYTCKLNAAERETREQLKLIQTGLGKPLGDSVAELSSYDNHPGDLGSEVFERSKDLALRDQLSLRLKKIARARERLAAGTYGICPVCDREIDPQRLEVEPEADLCLECRQRQEAMDNRAARPVEEDVLNPPFPRRTPDGQAVYDDEDAWQEVARWSEHAERSRAGSYYGGDDVVDEDQGALENVDKLPVYRDPDTGMFFTDTRPRRGGRPQTPYRH